MTTFLIRKVESIYNPHRPRPGGVGRALVLKLWLVLRCALLHVLDERPERGSPPLFNGRGRP